MKFNQRKRATSVLALTFDGGQLHAVVLRRTNGTAEVRKSARAPMTLDLLRNEPELVGGEIRNLLDSAEIRERLCVVGIPAEWVLSLHAALPELPDEDVESFLELEAERGFPHGLDQLQREVSRPVSTTTRYATQLAVMDDHVRRLEAVLTAAQLRPVRFSLAITALPDSIAGAGQGNLTAVVNESGVALLISSGGGIVALRTFDHVIEAEGGERRVLADAVARELRITLAQLPEDLRETLRELRVVGAEALTEPLVRGLEVPARALGLEVRRLTASGGTEHGLRIAGDASLSGSLSLAAQFLGDRGGSFNFLPPKPSFLQQLAARYSGKRLAYAGGAAAAVAAAVCAVFLVQSFQLSRLQSRWNAMSAKVRDLEETQARIRAFRPWNDKEVTSLAILRQVTEAFPEEGSVTAKTVEIRNQSSVNVTGVTRDNSALLKTLDQLRLADGVAGLKVETIRGKSPMQFTFNFQWESQP